MNERIKELADEARLVTVNGQTRYALADEFEQRFAELIVRDIHQYVDDLDTAQIISRGILKRYGVEE
jgi:hypothetical protein